MKYYRFELHCHTFHSDGSFSPEELATLDRLQQKLLTNLSTLTLQAKEDILL